MARRLNAPPSIPSRRLTPRGLEVEQAITADLEALVACLEQRCLDNAVLLAQQAARRQGPLVAHFMELGKQYQETLRVPEKPKLRLVKGGAI